MCRANETCRSVHEKSRNGVCRCADGLTYADDGVTCVVDTATTAGLKNLPSNDCLLYTSDAADE